MIFLDANYVLRYLVQPDSLANQLRHDTASALFEAIARGDEVATTSEAVLAEVAFVLSSKRQYGLPAVTVAAYLGPILRLSGLKLPRGRKRLYLRALDLWVDRPKLGFVDALTAAMIEHTEVRLATFDSDFSALANISIWRAQEED
jgi:predicted nucleic acid-binding protein